MNLLERPFVCSRLAISQWQSYNLFPVSKTGLIREADVVALVNERRRALPPFEHIPALVTAEEIESDTSVPKRKLALWSRRRRNPIPHVRINSHVVRFPVKEACEWLEEQSR